MSSSPSASSSGEIHVRPSATIPFPAPAPITPLRSKRNAAHAATSAMSKALQKKYIAADGSDAEMATESEENEPDLTNDDTAESWSAGEAETEEAMYNEEDEANHTLDEPSEIEEPVAPPPRKRKAPVKRKAKVAAVIAEGSDDLGEGRRSAKKSKSSKKETKRTPANAKVKQVEEDDILEAGNASDGSALTPAEDFEEEKKPKKQRKPRTPRAPKPEPVYVISEVAKLPNPGYKGKLGYACLNTILRTKKPPVFCSRTCR